MKKCTYGNCNNYARTKGLCNAHYAAMWRKNKALNEGRPYKPREHPPKINYRRIAEIKIGRQLKGHEVVHHIDGNRENNNPDNLMVCKDRQDHCRVHWEERQKKLSEKQNVFRECFFCKESDDTAKMMKNGRDYYHMACANKFAEENKPKGEKHED